MIRSEFLFRTISSIVLIPITIFIVVKGSIYFNSLLIICFFISVYEWFKISNSKIYGFLGLFFLLISFLTVYLIRNNNLQDYDFFLFLIIICISTDIGGYFFGKVIKGPKLTKLSPNKTYAGMFGSYILSFISVYLIILFKFFDFILINSITKIYFFVFFISTISQLGDILISYFKRKSNLKDTGKLIPGHGGLLDRIDGMIFVFPFSYLIYALSIIRI